MCPALNSRIKPHAICPTSSCLKWNHRFVQCLPSYSSLGDQIVCCGIIVLVFKSPWLQFVMAAKYKSSDAGNSDMPKRSCAVLPFTEKRKVLDLVREKKKKIHMLSLLRSKSKNKSSILKTVKEKYICVRFALHPQTAKVAATVHGKCLIRRKKQ